MMDLTKGLAVFALVMGIALGGADYASHLTHGHGLEETAR